MNLSIADVHGKHLKPGNVKFHVKFASDDDFITLHLTYSKEEYSRKNPSWRSTLELVTRDKYERERFMQTMDAFKREEMFRNQLQHGLLF
eukprot:Pgem_evm2s8693